jgi:P4 family phage/plasmid primase-like protien
MHPVTLTFGQTHTQSTWTDVRQLPWSDLQEIFTTGTVGPKEGSCAVPARFRGTNRRNGDADQIDVAFLDSDCGHTLAEIQAAIRRRGWSAIVHSTHSHLSTTTEVRVAAWEKFATAQPERTAEKYLLAKGYLPSVAAGAWLRGSSATTVTLAHQPCPKFRVIVLLAHPWRAANYPTQDAANAAWKEAIERLAAALGLSHDQSCTDTARLFFLPRRRQDAPFETAVLEGAHCDIWSLPRASAQASGTADSAHTHPNFGKGAATIEFTDPRTGETFDLTSWANQHGSRFEIARALRARAPASLVGHVVDGIKHHIRCPFDDEHTQVGPDLATFVIDAGDARNPGGFVCHCRHAHCVRRDRLLFLRRMMEHGWLTIPDLTDPAFLRDAESFGDDRNTDDPPPSYEDVLARAQCLTPESALAEIETVLAEMRRAGFRPMQIDRLLTIIRQRTGMRMAALRAELRTQNSGDNTDLGMAMADRTLRRHYAGGDHLIRAADRSFWVYDRTHWRRTTDEAVFNKILSVVQVEAPPGEDLRSLADTALRLIIGLRATDDDVLRLRSEPPPVINCQNGELWIGDDGAVELRPHRADSYLTYVLDAPYDPTAACPRFDAALLGIFAKSTDPTQMARHFCEFIGYLIQPKRDIACFFMLRGAGQNGKTKLMQTVEHLINRHAICATRLSEIERDKFAIGALAGKLILLDDDIDTGTKLPDGFLKAISERKLMTGQLKFKDQFEFIATCVPVLLANNYPLSADISWGLRRRARIIPFDRIFSKDDRDDTLFPAIWRHELPGILNRAIEGLQRLRRRGDFDEPADCIKAREDWLAQANPLAAFIAERCIKQPSATMPLQGLYKQFEAWADECGVRSIPSRGKMKANLENLGYVVDHSRYGTAVYGITTAGSHYKGDDADAA